MDDPKSHLVRDKGDLENARALVAMGYPAVAAVLPHMVEWVRDGNWPVARVLASFLATVGEPVIPELQRVFASDDDTWKYFCITHIVGEMDRAVAARLRDDLRRIAESPTPGEGREEVNDVAAEALAGF